MERAAKMNAIREAAKGLTPAPYTERLLPVIRKPPAKAMIDRLAPNTAALVTPSVDGEAMELPSAVCMISPERDRPAPAVTAAMTRGRRIFCMMRTCAGVPLPRRAPIHSRMVIPDGPASRHTKAMTRTAGIIIRRTFLLCFIEYLLFMVRIIRSQGGYNKGCKVFRNTEGKFVIDRILCFCYYVNGF